MIAPSQRRAKRGKGERIGRSGKAILHFSFSWFPGFQIPPLQPSPLSLVPRQEPSVHPVAITTLFPTQFGFETTSRIFRNTGKGKSNLETRKSHPPLLLFLASWLPDSLPCNLPRFPFSRAKNRPSIRRDHHPFHRIRIKDGKAEARHAFSFSFLISRFIPRNPPSLPCEIIFGQKKTPACYNQRASLLGGSNRLHRDSVLEN